MSIKSLSEYQNGRKAVQIAATKSAVATLLDDGELVITGVFNTNSENSVAKPTLSEGETILQIEGGAKHFSMLTSNGNIYSFGDNNLKQCKVPKKTFGSDTKLVACAFQNYVIGSDSKIEAKWGCKGYLMGTDELGRNVFLRIMHGGKQTMTIGAVAVIISTFIAVIIGCLSGYFGGWVDKVLLFITDVTWCVPGTILALAVVTVLGKGLTNSIIAISLVGWASYARTVRAKTMSLRTMAFVETGRAFGESSLSLMFRYILPNIVPSLIVLISNNLPGTIMATTTLSFLGLGSQPPSPDWGLAISQGMNYVHRAQWLSIFPGLALVYTVLGFNILGEGMRDLLDPRLKGL